ncbi:MAG TPA: hypothetical protein VGD90_13140, partial [Sphingobacteriaceae bacterium]
VIGGLLLSTLTSLLVLPHLFVIVRKNASRKSNSLDPDDEARITPTKTPVQILAKKEVYDI